MTFKDTQGHYSFYRQAVYETTSITSCYSGLLLQHSQQHSFRDIIITLTV